MVDRERVWTKSSKPEVERSTMSLRRQQKRNRVLSRATQFVELLEPRRLMASIAGTNDNGTADAGEPTRSDGDQFKLLLDFVDSSFIPATPTPEQL